LAPTVVLILITLASALVCHAIARRRGSKPVFWAIMGALFGPLAIPFAFLSRPRTKPLSIKKNNDEEVPREAVSQSSEHNRLSDFPASSFTIRLFCDSCGHPSDIDRTKVAETTTIPELTRRLRCTECGGRKCSIRIIYSGAGGFRDSVTKHGE
jgi:hypothetical protein